MRYRKLDAAGDYSAGHGLIDFYVDQAEAVAQAAQTRLALWLGDWFLDATAGTAWLEQVLGTGTAGLYDLELRSRILGTPGVRALLAYGSTTNPRTRALTVSATLDTIYGPAAMAVTIPPARPPLLVGPADTGAISGGPLLTGVG